METREVDLSEVGPARYDVGAADGFRDGEMRVVRAGRIEVGVARLGRTFYALHNRCPHAGGPLCLGRLAPHVKAPIGAAGTIDLDRMRPVISCPWHGWEYDVATGRALMDPKLRVRTYPVVVEEGRVYVDTSRHRQADG